MNTCKISNKENRAYKYSYQKDFKCSVFHVEGQRKNNFKMPLERNFGITERYLVIQAYVPQSRNCTITIQLADDSGNHFNFAFSTLACKRNSTSQMGTIINLPLPRDKWLNLCFDIQQFSSKYCSSGSFYILDGIEISPSCYIRDIYAANDGLSAEGDGYDLPKIYNFPSGVSSTNFLIPESIPTNLPSLKKNVKIAQSKSAFVLRPNSRISVLSAPRTPKTKTPKPQIINQIRSSSCFSLDARNARKQISDSQEKKEENPLIIHQSITSKSSLKKAKFAENDEDHPANSEEELDLVFIENLGCYYCPSNQQYYELNGSK